MGCRRKGKADDKAENERGCRTVFENGLIGAIADKLCALSVHCVMSVCDGVEGEGLPAPVVG